MAQLNEKETSFELIEALLIYIKTLNVPGAVLVFLPGWNLIYTLQKHLEMNPRFGTRNCGLLHFISFSKGNYRLYKAESWLSGLESWIDLLWEWMSRNLWYGAKKKWDLCSSSYLPSCVHVVGGRQYRILPLHSQIPLEEQRRVFDPVPPGVTKVREPSLCRVSIFVLLLWNVLLTFIFLIEVM